MEETLIISARLRIPRSELTFRFARGGGPGGQNVNKVETRVELLFDVAHSPLLTAPEREAIRLHLGSRINDEGVLQIVSQESRSQWQNRETAVKKFVLLLRKALTPQKKRVKTRVSHAAKQKRLDQKKRRSMLKRLRGIDRD